jgi:hypothetical protein
MVRGGATRFGDWAEAGTPGISSTAKTTAETIAKTIAKASATPRSGFGPAAGSAIIILSRDYFGLPIAAITCGNNAAATLACDWVVIW